MSLKILNVFDHQDHHQSFYPLKMYIFKIIFQKLIYIISILKPNQESVSSDGSPYNTTWIL